MKFTETILRGIYIIEPELLEDERGFFARTFCTEELAEAGIEFQIKQCNVSFNHLKGTIRGMHYQAAPHGEGKIVRCTRGMIYDVVVDIRPESSTYLQWISVTLDEHMPRMLFIPEGFAHGFQTLEDNTEVFYHMNNSYQANFAAGIRWDDPKLGIEWPLSCTGISDRDRNFEEL
ncbi:dTDP-4-dehydrorhamnose 3,5-epimerase [Cohnella endophytica]|uniref:dTDP-4-dehydrorhamnose 3,5-epimerase n=1 Tax=Cohnella endophytica TaxID=2419778 RepID=A0A494XFG2_9BACL|nr:dTDP-4-dehydrorhamnose 3,5-epimerase [Cohnella endophytica]RKP47236.1 dTDP-4-dehydrorhamnose 3,5-epimerase [Cohnella endophytica]